MVFVVEANHEIFTHETVPLSLAFAHVVYRDHETFSTNWSKIHCSRTFYPPKNTRNTVIASFPGSPPRAHEYCVTFDPHEESRFFVWVKGHAIDVRTREEPGNEARYILRFAELLQRASKPDVESPDQLASFSDPQLERLLRATFDPRGLG